MQETSAQPEQPPKAERRIARLRNAGLLGLLLLCAPAIGQQPVDPYGAALDKHFGATNAAPDWNQMTGTQIKMQDFEEALKAQVRKMAQTPPPAPAPPPVSQASQIESSLVVPVGLPSIGLIALALAGFCVKRKFDALALASEAEANRRLNVMMSDPALEAFFVALRDGMEGGAAVLSGAHDALSGNENQTGTIKEFFSSIADRFATVRSLISELARAVEEDDRKKVLEELCKEIGSLKEDSRFPALQPFWMLACALEGLLTQLLRETSELNASAQRTATAAIDLLQTLCVQDLNPNLATEPPVRILAVDDDAISRRAISFALKKVFERSTLAPEGKTALELATGRAFDVIFLDVEMPGMDGFELCTKIRETVLNKTAPIVFVTRHSDFESRAKSSLSGGQDLIGKPYLSFEITVKALTLILGNRLRGRSTAADTKAAVEKAIAAGAVSPAKTVTPAAQPEAKDSTKEPAQPEKASKPDSAWHKTLSTTYTTTESVEKDSSAEPVEDDSPVVSSKLPDSFSAWSPDYLETLRNQLQAIRLCTMPEHLQELVTGLYVAVHSFSVESKLANFPTVHRLSTALEAMLKKLMEKPDFSTPSVWNAAQAALELLAELSSRTGKEPGLTEPPPRILVVDDDPVARRAISGAVQLVFGKPDNAGDGETALTMASEKAFDLILLDVMMPGMDGFAACSKIHQTRLNRRTPIVFISNHDDAASREKAALSGGRGFIPKPVFSSQITLTALTSILRSRLEQSGPASVVPAQQELVASLM